MWKKRVQIVEKEKVNFIEMTNVSLKHITSQWMQEIEILGNVMTTH